MNLYLQKALIERTKYIEIHKIGNAFCIMMLFLDMMHAETGNKKLLYGLAENDKELSLKRSLVSNSPGYPAAIFHLAVYSNYLWANSENIKCDRGA